MNQINYKDYALEATKITFFCLVVTGLFKCFGVSNSILLIVFNMAVMATAATFSVEQKRLKHVVLGGLVIVLSTIAGGMVGFYYPALAKFSTILYASLAFYLPQKKYQMNIFLTGSTMFLIFSALPFNFQDGIQYLLDGLVVFMIFMIFYWLFDYKKQKEIVIFAANEIKSKQITAMIALISLTIACFLSAFLAKYYHFTHLYWIELTVLLVIQGSQQKTIQTSLKRIFINAFGAIVMVFLFTSVLPTAFWVNFVLLLFFLFCIFFFSFSYLGRVLFIEVFVLAFTHLLGDYQNAIALDRILLTAFGGTIVILVTAGMYYLANNIKARSNYFS